MDTSRGARRDALRKPYIDFDYPCLCPEPRAGLWRTTEDAFHVEEVPLYPFSGQGEHAALTIRKRGQTTRDLALSVAGLLKLPAAAVGYAGMKDKAAVAVQAFTVTGAHEEAAARAFREAGAEVVSLSRHGNKLRLGHLAANRFRIVLEGGDPGLSRARLAELAQRGVPNYFGPQRFGADGTNAAEGLLLLTGRKKVGRWKYDLLVSAVQSLWFNEALARRMEDGLHETVLEGDVLQKAGSGGVFVCREPQVDGARLAAFEVSLTGPLPGKKMVSPGGEPLSRETAAGEALGLDAALFSRETGARRAFRFALAGVDVEEVSGGVALHFTAPAGAFATSVVREIAQSGVWRR